MLIYSMIITTLSSDVPDRLIWLILAEFYKRNLTIINYPARYTN